MEAERNALFERAYEHLRHYCLSECSSTNAPNGLELQIVDLRWGVVNWASSDFFFTDLAQHELANCARLSKVFCIVLTLFIPIVVLF